MAKQKIVVVMGGPSKEHEVSLNSGENMLRALDPMKYEATRVVISKSGEWLFGQETQPLALAAALKRLQTMPVDVVLLALHGTFGEDGTLQALLENRHIRYTGSSALASLLAMDKSASNALFESAGLLVPDSRVYEAGEIVQIPNRVQAALTLPVVVKPLRQGSSVGVSIVKKTSQITKAIKEAFTYDQLIMVQQYIQGREVSCGVLENNGRPYALPPTELIPVASDFFDYHAKYSVGGADEITPPEMPAETTAKIQDIAVKAHIALGCRAYSRTDMIVNDDGIHVIEINTLPGMTATSIVPQQAKAAGMAFEELIEYLVISAK